MGRHDEGTAILIREPQPGDLGALLEMLGGLGHPTTATEVLARLANLRGTGRDAVRVAVVGGEVAGLLALHWAPPLHLDAPVARITTLVVRPMARRAGVGRRLVEAAEALASEAGCRELELTTGTSRTGAHAFYRSLGFEVSSYRFWRPLEPAG